MQLPSLTFTQVQSLPKARLVDLRSPSEFARDHIPGAHNIPLLNDRQRAIVGRLWKENSPEQAFDQGVAFVEAGLGLLLARALGREIPPEQWQSSFQELAKRLQAEKLGTKPQPVENLDQLPGFQGPLVLGCWRGGFRSQSVTALLRALGENQAYLLEGGYKAYRHQVIQALGEPGTFPMLVVLHGPTGVGKTKILQQLEEMRPGSALDLEDLAQHRSSILGDVGLSPAGQSWFESRLWDRMRKMGPGPWFVEGESRKVGNVVLPAPLWSAMRDGVKVALTSSKGRRIARLVQEYGADPSRVEQLSQRLKFFEANLGAARVERWRQNLNVGELEAVAAELLQLHYDPLYAKSEGGYSWAEIFSADDPEILTKLLSFQASLSPQTVE